MKCKRCGAKFGKSDYCTSCGASRNYVPESEESIHTEIYANTEKKRKKRSVVGMILSTVFTFLFAVIILSTICIRDIFDTSLYDALDDVDWSEVKIGRVVSGYDKNTTFTQYIASFIDDPRMNEAGIETILKSDELENYIEGIAENYDEIIFEKGEFKELSSKDIVEIVRANEAEISDKTEMPFNEIGDIIYNDIDKTLSEPVNSYNSIMGEVFSGTNLFIIRFMFSDAGIITQSVIMIILLIISAISFKKAGNGIKSFGITIIIPSLATAVTALLSKFIVQLPVLHELMPNIKSSFIQFGFIFTGFGAVFVVIGIVAIMIGESVEKSKLKKEIKKANATALKNNDEDEIYEERIPVSVENQPDKVMYERKEIPQSVPSDAFSATGKIPDISGIIANNQKVCSVCGKINTDSAKFCRNCGSKIQ